MNTLRDVRYKMMRDALDESLDFLNWLAVTYPEAWEGIMGEYYEYMEANKKKED